MGSVPRPGFGCTADMTEGRPGAPRYRGPPLLRLCNIKARPDCALPGAKLGRDGQRFVGIAGYQNTAIAGLFLARPDDRCSSGETEADRDGQRRMVGVASYQDIRKPALICIHFGKQAHRDGQRRGVVSPPLIKGAR